MDKHDGHKCMAGGLLLVILATLFPLGDYDPLIGWIGLGNVLVGMGFQLAYASSTQATTNTKELGENGT
jgi:hypothetical protein